MKPCAGCAKTRESERKGREEREWGGGSQLGQKSDSLVPHGEQDLYLQFERFPLWSEQGHVTDFSHTVPLVLLGRHRKEKMQRPQWWQTLACVLHLRPQGFSHQFTGSSSLKPPLYTVEQMKDFEGLHSKSSSKNTINSSFSSSGRTMHFLLANFVFVHILVYCPLINSNWDSAFSHCSILICTCKRC